ncbi:MAG TPA: prephenate dehydrogenase/arogenate dehydrogenase family protein [Candidatus Acidoferrales bacterium]|nr:prephenate dehydrogenase/arogenate dehydrogenase family protein [Candidatus Acidoferrales bacterium]
MFRRIAILGTGLIGGSFGLALRKHVPEARVIGWDRPEVLRQASTIGAIQEQNEDLPAAVRDADLVYLALPIGVTLDLLPTIARFVEAQALVTDACSTKTVLCRSAAAHFSGNARFLGGHPMAGREVSGIANADAELFRGAKYALIGTEGDSDPRVVKLAALLRQVGAVPVWLDAESHDRGVAYISHLPQILSVALGALLNHQTDEKTGLPLALAGPGLRDALRLAGSPYSIWRDICLTNREQIDSALESMIQQLDHLRTHLQDRALENEFEVANELYKKLRGLQ